VVLQRFRGELTILDSRQGGGASEYGDEEPGQVAKGGDFGRSSSQERRPAPSFGGGGGSGSGGGGGGSRYNDLDDDIPF
jgi:single-strand DNA-binding protein